MVNGKVTSVSMEKNVLVKSNQYFDTLLIKQLRELLLKLFSSLKVLETGPLNRALLWETTKALHCTVLFGLIAWTWGILPPNNNNNNNNNNHNNNNNSNSNSNSSNSNSNSNSNNNNNNNNPHHLRCTLVALSPWIAPAFIMCMLPFTMAIRNATRQDTFAPVVWSTMSVGAVSFPFRTSSKRLFHTSPELEVKTPQEVAPNGAHRKTYKDL